MAESVRHHIREEEADVLPKAEEENLDLDQLGKQMAARKQQLSSKASVQGSRRPHGPKRGPLKANRTPKASARKASTRSH